MAAAARIVTKILVFSCFVSLLQAEQYCYFLPPKKWECANPEGLSTQVEIGFYTKGSKGFPPSINLATEEVKESLDEYVRCVKKIHLADKNASWRDLGKFHSKAGTGELTEISLKSKWGELKLLQFILVKNGKAYVLTGASHKEDFSKCRKEIVQSFRSLQLTDDLLTELSPSKQQELSKAIDHLKTTCKNEEEEKSIKEWEGLQKEIVEKYAEKGPYFQILLIKSIFEETIKNLIVEKLP